MSYSKDYLITKTLDYVTRQKLVISQHLFPFREGIPMCKMILAMAWEYRLQLPDEPNVLLTSKSQIWANICLVFMFFGEVAMRIGSYLSDLTEKVKYWGTGWPHLDSCRLVVDIVWLFYAFIKMYVLFLWN